MSEANQAGFSGTVKQHPNFSPEKDVQVFVENLKHIGGDEQAICTVVSSRSAEQRQEIAKKYKETQGKNLIDDLKLYTRFDFQRVLVACFMPPIEYDAWTLHESLQEFSADVKSFVEILVSRSNSQIKEIRNVYLKMYGEDVEALIKKKTSGEFCNMLLMLSSSSRDESNDVPEGLAKRDAKSLLKAFERGAVARNYTFNEVFCTKNFSHLRAMFNEYKIISGNDIMEDIRMEFGGHMKDGLKAIAAYARYPPDYFAHRLYRSMKGLGTDDSSLTRVIVTRSEIDMSDIKKSFQKKYGQTLEQFVMGDTSFAYRTILLALIF